MMLQNVNVGYVWLNPKIKVRKCSCILIAVGSIIHPIFIRKKYDSFSEKKKRSTERQWSFCIAFETIFQCVPLGKGRHIFQSINLF